MKAALVFAAFVFCMAAPAGAAELSDAVAGHPSVTQFDLLKLVVTDLARAPDGSAQGKVTVPFKHIEGKDMLVDLPDPLAVEGIEVIPMPGDPSREIMLADFGQSEGFVADGELMALFTLDPKPRLLDVVQVGSDRFVAWHSKPVMLARDAPLLVITSEHNNSNQTYDSTTLVTVRGDRFHWIDSIFTFSEAYCGWQRIQSPTFTTRPEKGAAYASIDAKVVVDTKRTDDECGDDVKPPKPGKRTYETIYRWNPAKGDFKPSNQAISKLSEDDQKRF